MVLLKLAVSLTLSFILCNICFFYSLKYQKKQLSKQVEFNVLILGWYAVILFSMLRSKVMCGNIDLSSKSKDKTILILSFNCNMNLILRYELQFFVHK